VRGCATCGNFLTNVPSLAPLQRIYPSRTADGVSYEDPGLVTGSDERAHCAKSEVPGHRDQDACRCDQPGGRAGIEHEDHDERVEQRDKGEPHVRNIARRRRGTAWTNPAGLAGALHHDQTEQGQGSEEHPGEHVDH
jgi:hypothetical protein